MIKEEEQIYQYDVGVLRKRVWIKINQTPINILSYVIWTTSTNSRDKWPLTNTIKKKYELSFFINRV